MYAAGNPKTKKALKEMVAARGAVDTIDTTEGRFPQRTDGEVSVEGPHYPEPHRWYARCLVRNGQIVKVLS